jgi:competence protein ComGC
LDMAKKMHNKQAELAKKMAMAKKQKIENQGENAEVGAVKEKFSDKEIKERNDRLRFEELLKKQSSSLNAVSSDGYLNKQQEEEEIDAYRKCHFLPIAIGPCIFVLCN